MLVLLLAAMASPAAAQDADGGAAATRAETIAAAQAQKARNLTPYVPSRAELVLVDLKQRLLETPNGFYPVFDSVYSGGGFTLGAGYRRFYGDRTFWDLHGLYSVKSYKLIELGTSSIGLEHGRVNLHAAGGWRDATQVSYYGLGFESSPDAPTNFRMQQAYGGVDVRARGPGATFAAFGGWYEHYALLPGAGASPSIEQLHSGDTAPGLGASPDYVHLAFGGGVDTRPSDGYARHGGLYAATYHAWTDPDETYSFNRLQGEVIQHVPILRENWVLSFHGLVQTTLDDQSQVPYFLLPSLGSGSTLRGYPSWRFRDRHSVLASGEWRWIPSRMAMDMAIFYDAGMVAHDVDQFALSRLTRDVGVGVRFHAARATPLRIDVAHGREGFNVVFSGAAAF